MSQSAECHNPSPAFAAVPDRADTIWFLTGNICGVCIWRVFNQTHFWDSVGSDLTLQMCSDLLHRFPWQCLCYIKWRHQMSFQACFCWQRPSLWPKLWRFYQIRLCFCSSWCTGNDRNEIKEIKRKQTGFLEQRNDLQKSRGICFWVLKCSSE